MREGMRKGVCRGLTVVVAEDEDEDGLQTEEVEEIPGQTRHPADVEVAGHHAGLEH